MKKYLSFLLISVVAILIFKSGIYKHLIWKTHHNSLASFSFKYPSTWSVCDDVHLNLDPNIVYNIVFVYVYNKEVSCEIAITDNIPVMIISEYKYHPPTEETDIKSFLINLEEKESERLKIGLPITGEIPWVFERYESRWFLPKNVSLAKIESFIEEIEGYIFLYQGRVYGIDSIKKLSNEGFGSLPSKLILWSFKLY